jgi:drug/metabolite transporter (DMT)-like permease
MANPAEPEAAATPATAGGLPAGAERTGAHAVARAAEALRTRARVLLFVAAVFFGLAAILVKIAARAGMSGGQVTLVRFLIGLGAVVAVFRARPGTFRPARWDLLAARGGFGGVSALLYFLAIQRIPVGEATLLNGTFPFWAILLSIFLLGERPTVHLAIALAIAGAGVFLVLGGGQPTFRLGTGEVLGLVSAISGGAAVTAIRTLRASANVPAATVFFAFALGGITVGLPSVADAWTASPVAWAAAAGVGASAFVAQLAMTEAYGQLAVPEAALWQQLTPIASYLWGFALGEAITGTTAIGILLGVGGVVYGSILGHRTTEETSPAARVPEFPTEEP